MIIEYRNSLDSRFSTMVAIGMHSFANNNRDVNVRYPISRIHNQMGPLKGDGVIAQSQSDLRPATKQGLPCVNISSRPMPGIPQVCCDNQAIYDLVFDHLRDRNFRTVAMLHDEQTLVGLPRKACFMKNCSNFGYVPHVIDHWSSSAISIENETLVASLERLPKPAAIVLTSDKQWPRFSELCIGLGLRIPEDVAVVGVDNVSDISSSKSTTLSSVDINAERIGYVAASVLTRLIAGEGVPELTLVRPKELIVRHSSDITIHLNPDLTKAVDYLHTHLHEAIEMEDIVGEQRLGRRALELHFKATFNETPMQYLRRLRMEKVRNLLETTTLSVTEIGRLCGLPNINYLCRLFRKVYHQTPLDYRKQPTIRQE